MKGQTQGEEIGGVEGSVFYIESSILKNISPRSLLSAHEVTWEENSLLQPILMQKFKMNNWLFGYQLYWGEGGWK